MKRKHEVKAFNTIDLLHSTGARYRQMILAFLVAILTTGCSTETRREQSGPSGEALFLRHCAGCHPDGKNIIYPPKDLRQLTLAANGISKPEDIAALLRNPGRGMPRFDRTAITSDEAHKIAEYVLTTFR